MTRQQIIKAATAFAVCDHPDDMPYIRYTIASARKIARKYGLSIWAVIESGPDAGEYFVE